MSARPYISRCANGAWCSPATSGPRSEENLYAIAKHVEALRGQDRWGVGSLDQAFAGYAALQHRTEADPWELLGVATTASEPEILAAYRDKAKSAHPDVGGSHEAFAALSQAKDTALATLRSRRGEAGMKVIGDSPTGAWLWIDENQVMQFSTPAFLAAHGILDTPENRRVAETAMRKVVAKKYPNVPIREAA